MKRLKCTCTKLFENLEFEMYKLGRFLNSIFQSVKLKIWKCYMMEMGKLKFETSKSGIGKLQVWKLTRWKKLDL